MRTNSSFVRFFVAFSLLLTGCTAHVVRGDSSPRGYEALPAASPAPRPAADPGPRVEDRGCNYMLVEGGRHRAVVKLCTVLRFDSFCSARDFGNVCIGWAYARPKKQIESVEHYLTRKQYWQLRRFCRTSKCLQKYF